MPIREDKIFVKLLKPEQIAANNTKAAVILNANEAESLKDLLKKENLKPGDYKLKKLQNSNDYVFKVINTEKYKVWYPAVAKRFIVMPITPSDSIALCTQNSSAPDFTNLERILLQKDPITTVPTPNILAKLNMFAETIRNKKRKAQETPTAKQAQTPAEERFETKPNS